MTNSKSTTLGLLVTHNGRPTYCDKENEVVMWKDLTKVLEF